MTGTSRNKSIW